MHHGQEFWPSQPSICEMGVLAQCTVKTQERVRAQGPGS